MGAPRRGGVLLLVGVGLPFPSPTRKRGGKEREGEGEGKRGCAPSPSPIRTPHGRGHATSWLLPSLSPQGPLRPNTSPGGSGNPSGTPVLSETSPEHFRCPNIAVQFNLYVSTISRLLVMSVISFGTPNKLRYIKSHNS